MPSMMIRINLSASDSIVFSFYMSTQLHQHNYDYVDVGCSGSGGDYRNDQCDILFNGPLL